LPTSSPSALITDHGRRISLRIQGRYYELTHEELRTVLGLPSGPAGLGITIERDHFCFEFAGDGRVVELSANQLHRRLDKVVATEG
jgi:hypothetical protein